MAISTIAGQFGRVEQISCILYEGNITVPTSGYDTFGPTPTVASEIIQGEWVSISTDTANTYSATGGLPVVTKIANGSAIIVGQIIDTPRWVKYAPSSQTTWSTMLSGSYYRVATVAVFPMNVYQATLKCANAAAVTPGTLGVLKADVSEMNGTRGLVVNDVASGGGNNIFSFHYAAQDSGVGSYSILVGVTGPLTGAT